MFCYTRYALHVSLVSMYAHTRSLTYHGCWFALWRGSALVGVRPGLVLLDGDGDELALQPHLGAILLRAEPQAARAAHARHEQVAADHRPLAVVVGLAPVGLHAGEEAGQPQAEAARLLFRGRRAQRLKPRRLLRILLPLARRALRGLGALARDRLLADAEEPRERVLSEQSGGKEKGGGRGGGPVGSW